MQWQEQLFKLFPEPMRIRAAQCTAAESCNHAATASFKPAPPALSAPGTAERQPEAPHQAGNPHFVLLPRFQTAVVHHVTATPFVKAHCT